MIYTVRHQTHKDIEIMYEVCKKRNMSVCLYKMYKEVYLLFSFTLYVKHPKLFNLNSGKKFL